MNDGGKRKIKIVWNIETRFNGIWWIIICLNIEFQWSWRLWNCILFISPWRWRIDVVINGTKWQNEKKIDFRGQAKEKIRFLLLTADLFFDLSQGFFFFCCHARSYLIEALCSSSFLLLLFLFVLHWIEWRCSYSRLIHSRHAFASFTKQQGEFSWSLFFSFDHILLFSYSFRQCDDDEGSLFSLFFSSFLFTMLQWSCFLSVFWQLTYEKQSPYFHIYIYIFIIKYEHINCYKKIIEHSR